MNPSDPEVELVLRWKECDPVSARDGEIVYGTTYPPDKHIVYKLSFIEGGKTFVYVGERKDTIFKRLGQHFGNTKKALQVRLGKFVLGGGVVQVFILTDQSYISFAGARSKFDLSSKFQRLAFEGVAAYQVVSSGLCLLNEAKQKTRKDKGFKRKKP